MDDGERFPGEGGAAYRDEQDAARARVQALERELGDARLHLAAMQPPPEPGVDPALARGLGFLFWSLAAAAIVALAETLAFRWLFTSLEHDAFRVVFAVSSATYLATTALAIAGLALLLRPAERFAARAFVALCLAGHAAEALLGLFNLVQLIGDGLDHSAALATFQQLAWRVAALLSGIPLLLLYQRLARHVASRGLQQLVLGAAAAFAVQQALGITTMILRLAGGPRWPLLDTLRGWISLGVAALLAILAWSALRAARALRGAAPAMPAAPGEVIDPAWRHAAAGLRLHRAGVLVKVVAGVVGAVLLVAAAATRSADAAKAILVFFSLAGLTGGVLALWGVARFSRAPDESGAGGLGLAAALLMGGGLLVDLWVLVTVGSVIFGEGSRSAMRQVQAVEPVGLGLALAALLLLLAAFRRVALCFAAGDAARRTRQLTVILAVVLPAAVVLKLPAVARELGPGVLAIALPLFALGIYTLARYLGLLGALIGHIERRLPHY